MDGVRLFTHLYILKKKPQTNINSLVTVSVFTFGGKLLPIMSLVLSVFVDDFLPLELLNRIKCGKIHK